MRQVTGNSRTHVGDGYYNALRILLQPLLVRAQNEIGYDKVFRILTT